MAERETKSVERFRQMIDLTKKAKGPEKRLTFKRFEKGRCTCTSLLTAAAIEKFDNDDLLAQRRERFSYRLDYIIRKTCGEWKIWTSTIRRTRRRGGLLMVEAKKKCFVPRSDTKIIVC